MLSEDQLYYISGDLGDNTNHTKDQLLNYLQILGLIIGRHLCVCLV